MNVTKQMIEDLFNVITATLDNIAKVDPNAKSLTPTELAIDVLSKTFDSLKADIEKYFIQAGPTTMNMTIEAKDDRTAKAKAIAANAKNSPADTFEKIWLVAQPILDLVVDTAKANLPEQSAALAAIITAVDAVQALGAELAIDLPKLKQN